MEASRGSGGFRGEDGRDLKTMAASGSCRREPAGWGRETALHPRPRNHTAPEHGGFKGGLLGTPRGNPRPGAPLLLAAGAARVPSSNRRMRRTVVAFKSLCGPRVWDNYRTVISTRWTQSGTSSGKRRSAEEARSLQVNAGPCPEGAGPPSRASGRARRREALRVPRRAPVRPSFHRGAPGSATCLVPSCYDPPVSPESLLSPYLCPVTL